MNHVSLPRSWIIPTLLVTTLLALFFTGCMTPRTRKADRSTSVVSYLYPAQVNPLPPTTIPVLRLPLRVGVAFVPAGGGGANQVQMGPPPITELQKTTLLDRVAAEFRRLEYIQSIQVIPSSYLRPGGGFQNLNQVRSLFNVDVVALVAYDQVQFTSHNVLSFTYWTIVGAYLVKGNQNDTQTLMEAAVYDVESRHLLFRAPGGSEVKAGAAGVYVPQRLRADSAKGFDTATVELIANLKLQLEDFRVRVKASPGEVKIEHKPGYTGSGDVGGLLVGALGILGLFRAALRRRSRPAKTLFALTAAGTVLLTTGCYSVEQSMIERGYRWVRRGQTDTALTTFEDAIKKYPSSVLAHLGRADALFEAKRDREAIDEYDRTFALYRVESGVAVHPPGEKAVVGERFLSYQNRGLAFPFGIEAYLHLRRAGAFQGVMFSAGAFNRDAFENALADYDHALRLAPAYVAAKEQKDRLLREAERGLKPTP